MMITNELGRYFWTMLSSYKRMRPIHEVPDLELRGKERFLDEQKLIMRIRLMKEATINAKQAGERGISAKSVKKVTEVSQTKSGAGLPLLTRC